LIASRILRVGDIASRLVAFACLRGSLAASICRHCGFLEGNNHETNGCWNIASAVCGRGRIAVTVGAVTLGAITLAQPASAEPGDLVLASTADSGVKSNGIAFETSLSADGRLAVFTSSATNLDPADADGGFEVYAKDLLSGDIVLAASSDTGVSGNGLSFEGSPSGDGSTVGFTTDGTTLDPTDADDNLDVYVKDLSSGNLTLASTSDTGANSNQDSVQASLSADGHAVAFGSNATNLDPAVTANPEYITQVYVKDVAGGNITLATTSDTGVKANNSSYQPVLSADGGSVAFISHATTSIRPTPTWLPTSTSKDLTSGSITLASTSCSASDLARSPGPRNTQPAAACLSRLEAGQVVCCGSGREAESAAVVAVGEVRDLGVGADR